MTARAEREGQVVTRFAPSPTGRLHLGHALSAVRAHDLARETGGRFLLRIEDIDGARSRPEHVEAILADLAWLGLEWDELSFQSARLELYAAALERMKAMGLVYPCFCTRGAIAASAPHGDAGPVYLGTCRKLVAPDLSRTHCWRLDVGKAMIASSVTPDSFRGPSSRRAPGVAAETRTEALGQRWMPEQVRHDGKLAWHDELAGDVIADPLPQGDVVLARKDLGTSYHLAVTVDDADQGVTDVVRGRDLFAATHVHRLLQALLGLPTPCYHHHPLIVGTDGERLAKRNGAPALAAMRERGEDGGSLAAMIRDNRLPPGFSLFHA